MTTRAVPGSDLSGDPGHEGSVQPMGSLRGTCTDAYTQPLIGAENTGAPHPGPNAMDSESPSSGFLGGSAQSLKGGGVGGSSTAATA
jgi:hypothetical protein